MGEEPPDEEVVVEVIGDDYSRRILTLTREEPRSVEVLSEACGADPSTIYRRIERLQEAGLLEDRQELDPGGHHYKVYAATLREVTLRFEEEGLEVEVRREEETAADRFTRLYEGFK
ncbi:ArsR/SmtB family transcription factor [Natronomonas marina]|jgi:DNA-binding transcriptional ArsR family regulator|uniref:ArsR/SmtB family transcription factor n=1 Tax=Natronomonas marina TaxID=2961939 RepID=UPI0020C94BB7|nr:winged helix-turn-helix domain-containing protein [Natronomonas marina]